MVRVDRHDVFIACNRPVGSNEAVRGEVDGIFIAKTLEQVPIFALTPHFRINNVDSLDVDAGCRGHFFSDAKIAGMHGFPVRDLGTLQCWVINALCSICSHFFSSGASSNRMRVLISRRNYHRPNKKTMTPASFIFVNLEFRPDTFRYGR